MSGNVQPHPASLCLARAFCLLPLRIFLFLILQGSASAFAVVSSLPPTPKGIVISTEGGALCRRSGETPHFVFALALHLGTLRLIAQGVPWVSHSREGTGTPVVSSNLCKRCG